MTEKCSAKECDKDVVFAIKCDDLKTKVCEDHMVVHAHHFLNAFKAERIEPIVDETPECEWE